jgi:hypothetical protein
MFFMIAIAWTTLAHAGPKDDALSAYDKFFTSFTTGNQTEVAALFAPDAVVSQRSQRRES